MKPERYYRLRNPAKSVTFKQIVFLSGIKLGGGGGTASGIQKKNRSGIYVD